MLREQYERRFPMVLQFESQPRNHFKNLFEAEEGLIARYGIQQLSDWGAEF
jgi:hypothetical protein